MITSYNDNNNSNHSTATFHTESASSSSSLWANDHLLSRVYEYLCETDLCAVTACCKALRHAPSEETAWRRLVLARWSLTERTRKSLGGASLSSSRELYRLLQQRLQIPDGRFTGKHCVVFGRGERDGLAAWLLLAHASSATLRETRFQGELCRRVDLRVCVQNLRHHSARLSLRSDEALRVECTPSEEIKDGLLPHSELRVLARNGALVSAAPTNTNTEKKGESHNDELSLKRLEHAVLGCSVYCPESVESEPDFLTMLSSLSLSLQVQSTHTSSMQSLSLSLRRCGDEEVWSHYQTLPNGLVMLRDKQNNW